MRQGSFVRPIVFSSDSSKDGCEGWLRRMVAKDGCEARCGKDRSFVRSFIRPIVRRMVAKDGCEARCGDSLKDGCEGWLRSKVRR